MRKGFIVAAVAAGALLGGCGIAAVGSSGGPDVDRSFAVQGFERLTVAGSYDVEVRTGPAPSVRASGPEGEVDRLVVEVEGDRLTIRPKQRGFTLGWKSGGTVKLLITVPQLREAELAGSGDMRIDRLRGEAFTGTIAGAGDITLGTVELGKLALEIAGSGTARVQGGTARSLDLNVAGAGDIDAAGVTSETAEIAIAGAGDIKARATRTAKVDIMGAGDVVLTGGAQCTVNKMGGGDVRCS